MKILVFGETGQVATELRRQDGIAVHALGRTMADLSNPETCAAVVASSNADAIINAAAYTAVDQAEEEEELATIINGQAPTAMARAAAANGIPFVQISTDYVFDGSGARAWRTDDLVSPINAYGRSKLAGEQGVRTAGGPHAILRTSWVVSAHGNNFVKTMLRLGTAREKLTIVGDQIGGPTCAADIAATCIDIAQQLIADPTKSGTYHLSGGPDVSWANFAREIFALSGRNCAVEDIPSSAYPTPAARPRNSRLDNSETLEVFGISRPNWQHGLNSIMKDLGEKLA